MIGADFVDVIIDLLDRLGDGQAQLAELEAERPPGDPEEPRGLELVAAGRLEDQGQEESVDLPVDVLIEIFRDVLQPLREEGLDGGRHPGPKTTARAWRAGRRRSRAGMPAISTGPVTFSSACFSTLCSSRIFPGQE